MGRVKEWYMEMQEAADNEEKYEWIKNQLIDDGIIDDDEDIDENSSYYQKYEDKYFDFLEKMDFIDHEKDSFVQEGLEKEGFIEDDDPEYYAQKKAEYEDFYESQNEEVEQNNKPNFNLDDITFISPKFDKNDFRGMRDTGFVISTSSYTIVHYEREEYRLVEIAERIKNSIHNHFILYDYKGSIRVNEKKVETALNKISHGGMINTSDGDSLIISYDEHIFSDTYYIKLQDNRLEKDIMYYLSKRNYAKANLVQNKKINNFEFKILIANDKSEFIAVVESNQTLDENVKNKLLKYNTVFEDFQSIVPRIFFISLDDDNKLSFYEFVSNDLKKINNLPTYEKLSSKLNGKEYKTNFSSIPTYGSDVPYKKEDCLDISADVDAFAKLISYKKSTMPLSIGLFGKWGSGKSFFMKELESKIKYYSEVQKNNDSKTFCENVVHVRFNAWNYSDSNLWASLTYRIFEEIDKKFNEPKDKIHILYENLESSQKEIKIKDLEKERLEEEISNINTQINSDKEKLEAEKEELKEADLFDFSKVILNEPTIKDMLSEIKKEVGLKNETIEDIRYINYEFKSWSYIFKRIFSDKKLRNLLLVLIILVICLVGTFFVLEDKILAILGSVVTFIGAITLHIKKIKPKLEKLAKYRIVIENIIDNWNKSKSKALELNYEKIKHKEQLISKLESNILIKEKELLNLKTKEYQTLKDIEDIKSGKYFKDFINSKVSSSEYKKHLGLISLIRNDFEELQEFLSEKNKDKRKFDIDRIILYIDDLDRCSDKLVVEVLEAVHLLLAFELFVVIVGIDLRWVKNSLGSNYSAIKDDSIELSSKDYVEKIFQIPFKVNNLNEKNKINLLNNLFNSQHLSYFESQETKTEKSHNIEVKTTTPKNVEKLSKIIKEVKTVEKRATTVIALDKFLELELSRDEVEYINNLVGYLNELPRTINRFVNTYKVIRSHEIVQKALAENFNNYKTIILLIIEVFWKESNDTEINFSEEFIEDYENLFSNLDEVKILIQRFNFKD